MNDFTKEELKHMQWAVSQFPLDDVDILYKLQSLIDNYCESEMDRKNRIYKEQILPKYANDHDKVPPYLQPDFNEGWK